MKKVKLLFDLFLVSVIVTSCGEKYRQVSDVSGSFFTNDPLKMESIPMVGIKTDLLKNEILLASNMMIIDNYLILHRAVPFPYYFDLYDLRTNDKLMSFGKQGNGPNELPDFGRSKIISLQNKQIGLVVPNNDGSYYDIYIDSLLSNAPVQINSNMRFGHKFGNEFEKLNEDVYAFLSVSSEKRVSFLGKTGNEISSHFEYPFPDKFTTSKKSILGMLYQAHIVKSHKNKRIGIFTRNSLNWDIVDYSDIQNPKIVSQFHLTSPKAEDASRKISENSYSISVAFYTDNVNAFTDVEATDRYIYALFSGRTMDDSSAGLDFGNVIFVFDWEGNLIKKLLLDYFTNCIALDKNGMLYSIVENEEQNVIYKYDISKYID